ncbi:MAG: hypothetical protein ACHQIK_06075 [Candidatus Acidiferrales bacterium]
MMETFTESARTFLQLRVIRADPPCEAVFLESKFPAAPEELPLVSGVVGRLVAAASQGRETNLEAFVQLPRLAEIQQMERLAKRAREWQPIMGLGIWPDREPPTRLTIADVVKLLPGQRPRIDKYKVCRISASGKTREQAWTSLLGTGAVLLILTSVDTTVFLKKTRDVLFPPIQDESFRHSSFYVPLLECKSIESARGEQLESWLCGASLYIRESTEDGGVLIASREPLRPILESLGGRISNGSHAEWQVPC